MAISSNGVAGLKTGVCTSTTRPSGPYEGQMIYETDTDMVAIWNGTAWRYIAATTPTNGTVLQTVVTETATSLSYTNQDVDTFWFESSITPKSSTSKILFSCNLNGINNGGGGRLSFTGRYNTTSSANTGSYIGGNANMIQIAEDSSGVNGVASGSYSSLISLGSTSTNYFKLFARKNDSSTAWNANVYGCVSSITLMEIAG
jgi:hypothetical protein